jgi:hypothetical protein
MLPAGRVARADPLHLSLMFGLSHTTALKAEPYRDTSPG